MIIANKISSNNFCFLAKHKTFTVDLSELPRTFNPTTPVYDDACDAGFVMISAKTGKEIIFILDNVVRNEDNELMFYEFTADPSINRGKISETFSVQMFND